MDSRLPLPYEIRKVGELNYEFVSKDGILYHTFFLPVVYLMLHARTYRKMKRIKHGKALNLILGENARNMFIYGILFSLGVLIDFYLR